MQHGPQTGGFAPAGCYAVCRDSGYAYFGLADGGTCFCENDLKQSTRYGKASKECMPIGGSGCLAVYEGGT